jgi:hypothetical protein
VFVVPGFLPVSDGEVAEFRGRHLLPDSTRVNRFVRHYLTTGNCLRRLGFIAGLTLPPLVALAFTGRATQVDLFSTKVLIALMVATLLAEVTLSRPSRATRRMASLRPRDLRSYLPGPLLYGPLVVGVAAAAAWGGTSLFPDQPSGAEAHVWNDPAREDAATAPSVTGGGLDRWDNPTGAEVAAGVALALVLPALTAAAEAWIVRRPQPFTDAQLVAADDGARAASARRIAAMACCIALLGLAGGLTRYSGAFNGPIDGVVAVAVVTCLVLAAWSWFERGTATSSAGARVSADARVPAGAPSPERA